MLPDISWKNCCTSAAKMCFLICNAQLCTACAVSLYSATESHEKYIIHLHRGTRVPFVRTFKILKHSLLQIMCMISEFPGMKLVHLVCSEQVTLLCLSWTFTRRKGYLKFKDRICGNMNSRKKLNMFQWIFMLPCYPHDFPGILSLPKELSLPVTKKKTNRITAQENRRTLKRNQPSRNSVSHPPLEITFVEFSGARHAH